MDHLRFRFLLIVFSVVDHGLRCSLCEFPLGIFLFILHLFRIPVLRWLGCLAFFAEVLYIYFFLGQF